VKIVWFFGQGYKKENHPNVTPVPLFFVSLDAAALSLQPKREENPNQKAL